MTSGCFSFLIIKQRLFHHPGTLWEPWLGSEGWLWRGWEGCGEVVPLPELETTWGETSLGGKMTPSSLAGMMQMHFGILNSSCGQECVGEGWRPRASPQVWAGGSRSK